MKQVNASEITKENSEKFKKSYMRWSYAVALCIPTLIFGLVACDMLLDYDFGRNMYLMSFICCGTVLSLLSLTWIGILNSRMFKEWMAGESANTPSKGYLEESSPDKRKADMSDIEKCIRKEGFVPVREDAYVRFKVSGEPVDVFYVDGKLSLVVNFGLDETVDLDCITKACWMLHHSTFMICGSLHKYDNEQQGLVFQVQAMVTSPEELDRYFGTYMEILFTGIERHREYYCKLLEEAGSQTKEACSPCAHEPKMLS